MINFLKVASLFAIVILMGSCQSAPRLKEKFRSYAIDARNSVIIKIMENYDEPCIGTIIENKNRQILCVIPLDIAEREMSCVTNTQLLMVWDYVNVLINSCERWEKN